MPITSKSPIFPHASKSGSRHLELEFIWASDLGGVAQAVVATFSDDQGKSLKRMHLSGPFSEPGRAREVAERKGAAWFDHGIE